MHFNMPVLNFPFSRRLVEEDGDKAISYSSHPLSRQHVIVLYIFEIQRPNVAVSESRAREKLLVLRPDVIAKAEADRSSNYSEIFSILLFPAANVSSRDAGDLEKVSGGGSIRWRCRQSGG